MLFNKNNIPWNKGLTKETDIRVKKCAEKNSISHLGKPSGKKGKTGFIPWNKDTTGLMPEPWNKNLKNCFEFIGIEPYRIAGEPVCRRCYYNELGEEFERNPVGFFPRRR